MAFYPIQPLRSTPSVALNIRPIKKPLVEQVAQVGARGRECVAKGIGYVSRGCRAFLDLDQHS
jgi:hypothetical protein